MKRCYRRCTTAVAVCALTISLAGTAWCATVSGSLAKSGVVKTGRIFLQLVDNFSGGNVSYGTSVASSTTSFTIQGVKSGSYQLFAFMDVQGYGVRHVMDPAWPTDINAGSGISVNVATDGDTVNVGTVTLANPANVSPVAVTAQVITGTGGNLIGWQENLNNDYYNITSYTDNNCTTGAVSHNNVPSGNNDMWAHIGGTSLSSYKVQSVTVKSDGTTATAISSCAKASAPGGGVTATGKAVFTASPSGPLFVALMDEPNNRFFVAGVASPVSPQTYSINNVPAGTYKLGMFLDPSNLGIINKGTIQWSTNSKDEVLVTVGGSAVTLPDLTLVGQNADIGVTTQHGTNGVSNDWYNLDIRASDGMKHPVTVQITGGPNLSLTPVDLGIGKNWPEYESWQNLPGSTPPAVGDTYGFTIGYSDGTSESVTRAVTGVINTIPTPTFPPPGGTVSSTFPLFAWTMPGLVPGLFTFTPQLENVNSNNSPKFLWTATSMTNSYGLSPSTSYTWDATVSDEYKNTGFYTAQFTTTSGGPTISGFTTNTGPTGTAVTINGSGFSTTPASNTVKFNGVTATVSTSTATALNVTVPASAPAGPVTVTVGGTTTVSPAMFNTTISHGGTIRDSAGVAISSATVALVEDLTKTASSNGSGAYSMSSAPSGVPYSLVFTASGKVPVYTSMMSKASNTTGSDYTMFTSSDLTGWGSTGGKGAIHTRVVDAGNGNANLAGVTISATSSLNPTRTFTYSYSGGGSVTDGTGVFTIPNVDEGDAVVVTAARPGYTFAPRTFVTHNGAVSENFIKGTPIIPAITGFSPGSGAPGNAVTITGTNFDPAPANNTVKFNGTTAVVQSASATQIVATVPNGATSGTISVTLTSNGQTATSAGSFTVTAPSAYNLNLTITGYGAPGSSVTCNGGACSPPYSPGTSLTMGNIPNSSTSVFGGWSGACTGTGGCTVVMNADQFLTADFDLMPVKDPGNNYYLNVSGAYAGAPSDGSSGTLKMQALTVVDTLVMNKNFNGGIDGGYNGDYTSQTGTTTIQGNCTVTAGSMTANHLIVKGQVTVGASGKAIPNGINIK